MASPGLGCAIVRIASVVFCRQLYSFYVYTPEAEM